MVAQLVEQVKLFSQLLSDFFYFCLSSLDIEKIKDRMPIGIHCKAPGTRVHAVVQIHPHPYFNLFGNV